MSETHTSVEQGTTRLDAEVTPDHFQSPPPDQALQDGVEIARREMDLAHERNALTQQLTDAKVEIASLNGRLSRERREHALTQAALIQALSLNTNPLALLKEGSETIQALQRQVNGLMTEGQPKVEYTTLVAEVTTAADRKSADEALAALENEGWEIVNFTLVQPISTDPLRSVTLKRETQSSASVQPAARTDVAVRVPDEALPSETHHDGDDPDPIHDADTQELEPVGVGAHLPPLATHLLKRRTRRPHQLGVKLRQRGVPGPKFGPEAIDHRVLEDGTLQVGHLIIDPQKMPYAATILQHGVSALTAGLDLQASKNIQAAMRRAKMQQTSLKPPPPRLGLSSD